MVLNTPHLDEKHKIFIIHEEKEYPLALALSDFINDALSHKVKISLQRNSLNSKSSKSIILVLCSPYSLSGSWIHYESGAASFLSLENNSTLVVIPICHSGLSTAELPYYLSSSQGIILNAEATEDTIKQKEKLNEFGHELIKSIKRELDILKTNTIPEFYENWRNAWHTIESKTIPPQKNTHYNTSHILYSMTNNNRDKYIKLLINKSKKTINFNPQYNHLRLLSQFLSNECNKIDTLADIRVQPFLWDGNNLFVGLRKTKYSNGSIALYDFGINPTTIYNIEYDLNKPHFPLLESDKNIKTWRLTQKDAHRQTWYTYIIKRLESINSSLWQLTTTNFQNKVYPSIILLNDSDDNPRLDICLLKIIDISNTDTKEIANKTNNSREVYLKHNRLKTTTNDISLEFSDWIWAKDGKIEYWYYTDSKDIPRNQYAAPIDGHIFLNHTALMNHYAYFTNITAYASDEEIQEGTILTDVFTTPARQLLTIF